MAFLIHPISMYDSTYLPSVQHFRALQYRLQDHSFSTAMVLSNRIQLYKMFSADLTNDDDDHDDSFHEWDLYQSCCLIEHLWGFGFLKVTMLVILDPLS